MRNFTKALTVVALLTPVTGYSLGIGDIRVRSALNQNLNAEISLVASRGENPSNIKVSLAPAEKFDEAGIPWTYFLSKLRFQPVARSNGSMAIKVTSKEAVKEPYINFLLEVTWPKGTLYREFTVLVDPPAEYQSSTSSYQEPSYQEPAYPPPARYESENTPPPEQEITRRQDFMPQRRPVRQNRVAAKIRRNAGAPSGRGSYGGQIITRRNDTLWRVAARARDAGVSVEQMMVALYEKNPHAFYQQNVNALSAGKRLTIPEKSAVQQLSQQDALAEFARHNEAWENNRSGVPGGPTQVAKEEAPDNQLTLVAPNQSTVGEDEAVSPSTEESAGASASGHAPATGAASKTRETPPPPAVDDALQSKVEAMEKKMEAMEQLIELKDKQLAELQKSKEQAPAATGQPPTPNQTPTGTATTPPTQTTTPPPVIPPKPEVTPPPVKPELPTQPAMPPVTQQVPPKPEVVPPKPVVKPTIKPVQPPPPEPAAEGFDFTWLAAIPAVLLPIFGWLWWRKRKNLAEIEADSMFATQSRLARDSGSSGPSSTLRKAGAVAGVAGGESSFLNDFKASDFESFESFNVDHGDIDPVAEADVYLAYGRYQQAEDLIKDAINETPDRDECKLKLLEIYHANSNKDAFLKYAEELVAAGKKADTNFWAKVSNWAKDIEPGSDLFAYAPSSTAAVFAATDESNDGKDAVLFTTEPEPVASAPTKPLVDPDSFGEATFEIDDDEDNQGASLDTGTEHPAAAFDQDYTAAPNERDHVDSDSEFLESSFDDRLSELQDNQSLDFDLGPFPGAKSKTDKTESAGSVEKTDREAAKTSPASDSNDTESYDFDFNMDKIHSGKPVKADNPQAENWDASQAINFSIEEPGESETLTDNTLEYNFNFDPSQEMVGQGDSFPVSDLTDMDEMETKLDLAKAYIDMGDAQSAKDIIEQVIEFGSTEQKKTAKHLLEELNID